MIPVYVSLTTIDSRLNLVERCVESLLRQSKKPNGIYLYVSETPFLLDKGVPHHLIPPQILDWESEGNMQIKYTKNIGPYRKLIPLLKEKWREDCLIATVDDDVIYPSDWLERMVVAFTNRPYRVSACRCRHIQFNDENYEKPLPYLNWPYLKKIEPGYLIQNNEEELRIFPTGRGGILYHPNFFSDSVFDETYLSHAPYNDDIWFKFQTLKKGVGTNVVRSLVQPNFPYDTEDYILKISLWNVNGDEKGMFHNDKQISNVMKYLGISKSHWQIK